MLRKGAINLEVDRINILERIRVLESEVFSEIVAVSGLDPRHDFRNADLRGVDFSGSDLSDFNFHGADLRGARWENLRVMPFKPHSAMFGLGDAPVSWFDLDRIVLQATKSKRWSERFMSVALLVENFGTTPHTADLIVNMIGNDKSNYFVGCSTAFFLGAYLRNDEICAYCKEMAGAGNAYPNIFRFNKLRRYLRDLIEYFSKLETVPERHPYFVNRFQVEEVISVGKRVI